MKARGIHLKAEQMAAKWAAQGYPVERIADLLNIYLPEQFYVSHGQIYREVRSDWVRAQLVEVK